MKNILKIPVMVLIVSISGLMKVHAQYSGYGLATRSAQEITDQQEIKDNAWKAVFGTVAEAKTVYRRLRNYTQEQLIALTGYDIYCQLGEPFNAGRPQDYDVRFIVYKIPSVEWTEFCEKYQDGYVIDERGRKLKFEFGEIANALASKTKSERIVMVITKKGTNRFAQLFADCLNGIHPRVTQSISTPSDNYVYPPAQTTTTYVGNNELHLNGFPLKIKSGQTTRLSWKMSYAQAQLTADNANIAGLGTVNGPVGYRDFSLKHTTTFILISDDGTNSTKPVTVEVTHWFGRNAAWLVPAGLVVIGGVAYLVFHHGDHVYSTEIQDTSGQPGTSGGQGGQHTFGIASPLSPLSTSGLGAGVPATRTLFAFHIGFK